MKKEGEGAVVEQEHSPEVQRGWCIQERQGLQCAGWEQDINTAAREGALLLRGASGLGWYPWMVGKWPEELGGPTARSIARKLHHHPREGREAASEGKRYDQWLVRGGGSKGSLGAALALGDFRKVTVMGSVQRQNHGENIRGRRGES